MLFKNIRHQIIASGLCWVAGLAPAWAAESICPASQPGCQAAASSAPAEPATARSRWLTDRTPCVWEEHRDYLVGAMLVFLLEGLLIGALINTNRLRKRTQAVLEQRTEALAEVNAELTRSELRFRAIAECGPVGIAIIDAARNVLYVNQWWERMFGYTKQDFTTADGWWVLAFPAEQLRSELWQRCKEALQEARCKRTQITPMEAVVTCKNGSLRTVELRVAALGEVNLVMAIDISERQRAVSELDRYRDSLEELVQARTEALRESESRFRVLFERNDSVMLLIEPDSGEIIDANAAASRFYGYSVAQLKAMKIDQISTLPAHEIAEKRNQALQRKCNSFVFNHRLANADVRTVEVRTSPITSGSRVLLFSIIQDITERQQVEQELRLAKAEVERANIAKSRFLAAASHDLRQPLSALSLYVGMLKNLVAPGKAKLVISIEDCVGSLSELLTDLLDVSKLDAGVVTPKLSDFAVDDLLAGLLSIYSVEAELKGLRLRRRRCSGHVRGDHELLQRIVSNFLTNAIRYTDCGGVLLACRIHQGQRWIEVWDTGIGIREDEIAVIFDEFIQLDDESRNRGSGLGLAIAAKTADLLGLRIRVRSRPGRGSMFAIELPAAIEVAGELPKLRALAPRALRIAVVEDNAQVREALVTALGQAGHEVIAADSGRALLERLGRRKPGIVIADYRLGAGETGFEVIDALRQVFDPELPAILVTGDTDPALVRSMANRGVAIQYKPLQMQALQSLISEVAGGPEA